MYGGCVQELVSDNGACSKGFPKTLADSNSTANERYLENAIFNVFELSIRSAQKRVRSLTEEKITIGKCRVLETIPYLICAVIRLQPR